jgi:hypothetical protein
MGGVDLVLRVFMRSVRLRLLATAQMRRKALAVAQKSAIVDRRTQTMLVGRGFVVLDHHCLSYGIRVRPANTG